jgi:hypothetical protein
MAFSRNVPAGLISKGFQKITTNSTATALNSTCCVGTSFLISVETQSVRVVFDGSTPAASTGVLLTAANSPYFFDGIGTASNMKFARVTAGAIIQAQAFGRPGDKVSA